MPLPISFDTHSFHFYMQDALLTTFKYTLNTNLSYYTPKTSCQPNEQAVSSQRQHMCSSNIPGGQRSAICGQLHNRWSVYSTPYFKPGLAGKREDLLQVGSWKFKVPLLKIQEKYNAINIILWLFLRFTIRCGRGVMTRKSDNCQEVGSRRDLEVSSGLEGDYCGVTCNLVASSDTTGGRCLWSIRQVLLVLAAVISQHLMNQTVKISFTEKHAYLVVH